MVGAKLIAAVAALLLAPAPAATASCGPGARESAARTPGGTAVTVCVSDAYPADPARVQSVADALGSLLHGPELSALTVAFATPADMALACGSREALACYSRDRITIPGELRPGSPPLAYLIAHEYGHHILAHRRNDPWPADAWGTKRWATALGVCPAARRRELFLGYASMPNEAFAESYAMQQFPLLHLAWGYTDLLAPDDATEAATRADVLDPWSGPTRRRYTGRSRRLRLAFPLDGTARFTVTGARLELYAGRTLLAGGRRFSLTICGNRRLTARLRGSGAYALTVSRP
jgi:hypothetical protein